MIPDFLRERWRPLLRGIVLAACLLYLVDFFRSNQEQLALLLRFQASHLFVVSILFVLYFFVYSYRFQLVVEACSGQDLRFVAWFKLVVIGRFLNGLLPQAGNVYRTVRLKQDFGVTHTAYATGLASYGWLDIAMNFGVALLLVSIYQVPIAFWGYPADVILAASLALVVLLPFVLHLILRMRAPGKNTVGFLEDRLQAVVRGTVASVRDLRHLTVYAGLGLILFGLMAGVFYLLFLGSGTELDVTRLAVFYALYRVTVYVTVTPGNLGVREIAYGVLGEQLGVGMGEGVIVAAVVRIVSYVVLAVLGALVGGVDELRSREGWWELEASAAPRSEAK